MSPSLVSHFDRFKPGAPLPRLFVRKRDGNRYWCTPENVTQHLACGPTVWLSAHTDGGRAHWKTLTAFKREFTNADGSAIE